MRHLYYGLLAVALFLLSGVAVGQQVESKDSTSAVRKFLMLESNDGRSHEIEAIAMGQSGGAEVIYVVEGVQDQRPIGSTGTPDGEYL